MQTLGTLYVQMGSKYFFLHQTRFETPEMVLLGEWRLVLGGRGQTLMGRLGAYIYAAETPNMMAQSYTQSLVQI